MKKIIHYLAAVMIVFGATILMSSETHAITKTWTGAGGDLNFSTNANWADNDAPATDGSDDLVFDNTSYDFDSNTPLNDTVDAVYGSITFQGSDDDYITIEGGQFTVDGNITSSVGSVIGTEITLAGETTVTTSSSTASVYLGVTDGDLNLGSNNLIIAGSGTSAVFANINGTGGLSKTGTGIFSLVGNNTFTGTVTASNGVLRLSSSNALGATSAGTTIQDGAGLHIANNVTVPEDINLTGSGYSSDYPTVLFEPTKGGDSCQTVYEGIMTGDIVLNSNDIVIEVSGCNIFEFTGTISGGGGIVMRGNKGGSLDMNGTITYLGSTTVGGTIVVRTDQSSTNMIVSNGGILNGTGTVGVLTLQTGATLAPGFSPGCLASGNLSLATGSVYEVEMNGNTVCTNYDQTDVTGTVTIDNATLSLSFLNDYQPSVGDSFVIIKNDGTDDVTGVFDGLDEGNTISASGSTFSISYEGGDGNDVELTVTGSDELADTGVSVVLYVIIGSAIVASSVLISTLTRKLVFRA